MSKPDKPNKKGMSRRDFLKSSAAATAAGTMLDWAVVGANPALAAEVDKSVRNICPYCSVGCAIKIDVDASNNILDIYGDPTSVINQGALCSKGAALIQLANSPQRIGIPGQTNHNIYGTSPVVTGGPMKRTGGDGTNNTWTSVTWSEAISDIATYMKNAKTGHSANNVAFFGSSHMVNEECYAYKKLITLYGTNNTEHQARI